MKLKLLKTAITIVLFVGFLDMLYYALIDWIEGSIPLEPHFGMEG